MKGMRLAVAICVLSAVTAVAANAQDAPAHKYVGVLKCKTCHNSEAKGAQYTKWTKMKHASAFTDLASDSAKAVAKAKGIADPQKDAACLKCHVTGYGEPAANFAETYKAEDGVTCESCHGAGSDYMKMAVMKAVRAGTTKGADVGLVSKPNADTCKKCHNADSPTMKAFDFSADSTKIAHPYPKN